MIARAALPAPTRSPPPRPARVVVAAEDPDPRTDGAGIARLRAAGIAVDVGVCEAEAEASMAGFFSRVRRGRPFVTLKLALSIDGRIALASGESQWITGEEARAHAHLERARADMILVGRGTYEADLPRLDVRLEGLEDRSPRRALLTGGDAPEGWTRLASPADIFGLRRRQRPARRGRRRRGDRLPRRRSGRSPARLSRPDPDRRGPSRGRRSWPRRPRRRARPLAPDRQPRPWRGPARRLRPRPELSMFTGIVTDIGTVTAVEQRGDARVRIACGYDLAGSRSRRLDRLLGRLPDRGRQGPGLVRGRCLGRDAEPHRRRPLARRLAAQPRTGAEGRRRARRPYRHRPCRRAGDDRGSGADRRFDQADDLAPAPPSRPSSPPRARSPCMASR